MSIPSNLLYFFLRSLRYRDRTQRQFLAEVETGKHPGKTAEFHPSRQLVKNCDIATSRVSDRTVLTISPQSKPGKKLILFFHGGAYLRNAVTPHWNFIYQLVQHYGYTVMVPDYPLAPESSYIEVTGMAELCYQEVVGKIKPETFILMGDSAGGGLALALAQKMRDDQVKQPDHIILLSPWLDVSLTNPDIREIEKKDALLLVKGLKAAGKAYAKNTSIKNPLVSPIYGEFQKLGKITLFTGTYDILMPDARKFKKMCDKQGIRINYFEYPKMIHDWMLLGFPESAKVLQQIDQIIGNG